VSYSYNWYSFNNVGFGLSLQSRKCQFYLITDNALIVRPLSAKNLNLRFGFNLFFGCSKKSVKSDCYWSLKCDSRTKTAKLRNEIREQKNNKKYKKIDLTN